MSGDSQWTLSSIFRDDATSQRSVRKGIMGLDDPVEFCSCHFSPPPSVKIPVLQAQEEDFWGGGMKLAKA